MKKCLIFLIVILLLLPLAYSVPTVSIVYPTSDAIYNVTPETTTLDLNWSVDSAVDWCAYDLDNTINDTSIGAKNFNQAGNFIIENQSSSFWASGVDVVGNYAYVTGLLDDMLAIIDISNKTNSTQVGYIVSHTQLDGPESVKVVGDYAYVASSVSDSLTIIDISTKTNPLITGFLSTTGMDGALDLFVSGNYAYVVSGDKDTLSIIDISNKVTPSVTGTVTNATLLNDARYVYVSGNYAYVSAYDGETLTVVNVTTKSAPVVVGNTTFLFDAPRGLHVLGNYVYLAAGNEFHIVDASDKTNLSQIGSILSGIGNPQDVYATGYYAYVGDADNSKMFVINTTDKTNPVVIFSSTLSTIENLEEIDVASGYLYSVSPNNTLTYGDTLNIIDIRLNTSNTTMTMSDGNHNVTIYCSDFDGAIGSSAINFTFNSTTLRIANVTYAGTNVSTHEYYLNITAGENLSDMEWAVSTNQTGEWVSSGWNTTWITSGDWYIGVFSATITATKNTVFQIIGYIRDSVGSVVSSVITTITVGGGAPISTTMEFPDRSLYRIDANITMNWTTVSDPDIETATYRLWMGDASPPTWLYANFTALSEGWCGQDNATNTTNCGGLSTGSYGEGGDT